MHGQSIKIQNYLYTEYFISKSTNTLDYKDYECDIINYLFTAEIFHKINLIFDRYYFLHVCDFLFHLN